MHKTNKQEISTEANKALARRFLEALSEGDFAVLDELYARDYKHHNHPQYPNLAPGREGFKQAITQASAFDDVKIRIEHLVAESDKVVARMHVSGIHNREFNGIPATGKPVSFHATDIYRIEGGRIVEAWAHLDFLAIMQQLGAVPMLAVSDA